jgi:hypothetical protein
MYAQPVTAPLDTSAPIIVKVKTRGAARAVFKCRDPEVLLAGPAGTGKSFACLWKLHLMCMANPGMRGLMVRKTLKSLTSTGLVTYQEHVAKDAISTGAVRWFGGSMREPAQFKYDNGSVIVVGGLDDPGKVMSTEYDVIYVQEATDVTLTDWEMLNTRARNGRVSFQQLIADCNPQQPKHWLKQRSDAGTVTMLRSAHEDNPTLFDDAGQVTSFGETYIKRLDALTGVRKERLRHGRWAAAEGLIYEGWNEGLHLADRKALASSVTGRLPLGWRRIWSIDFGYTNPFVWQQWAADPDGRLILEHEIYQTQTLVEDHAKAILDVVSVENKRSNSANGGGAGRTWLYPKPSAIICDHDAEDRATLERHLSSQGVGGTIAAVKTVSDGIQAVQARMKPAGDGRARIVLLRDALVSRDESLVARGLPVCTQDEIEGYVWERSGDGKPDKDRPLKLNDHGMDALRYVVANEDNVGRPRLRWLG